MRRVCFLLAFLLSTSLNPIFLYYLWIAAEYGRDLHRAAWHLVLLSWIMAGFFFLLTALLMYQVSQGSTVFVRIFSAHKHDVWPVVGLMIGLAITALYALPLLSRYRFRSEYGVTGLV